MYSRGGEPTLGCLFSIYSRFFVVQARRRKEKEEEKDKKARFGTLIFVSMDIISMEPVCMEISHLMYGKYGNPSLSRFGKDKS